jgi:hypothetical protein
MRIAARHGPALNAPSPKAGPCSVLIRAASLQGAARYRSTCTLLMVAKLATGKINQTETPPNELKACG